MRFLDLEEPVSQAKIIYINKVMRALLDTLHLSGWQIVETPVLPVVPVVPWLYVHPGSLEFLLATNRETACL